MNANDLKEIQQLYQKKIYGWNIGDAAKFAEPYSEDADFVGFDGTYLEGKQQIISFHKMLFDKFVRDIRLVGKVKHIRFPIPSVAIVVGISGTIERGHNSINPERNSIHTIVAVKNDHLWRFTSFQNTRAQYVGNPEKMEILTKELEQLIQARLEEEHEYS
ncbi:MAG TPA: SgcJ/EcaC family oxidoreductase [Phototrophicaceae bacterium]|nr:SgcJ/EcaC family oxidoreductase [Phototrophicaceae bacterium]